MVGKTVAVLLTRRVLAGLDLRAEKRRLNGVVAVDTKYFFSQVVHALDVAAPRRYDDLVAVNGKIE